jgi:hypothetical protein
MEEELEGERSTARRLRKERDAVVAKHKQTMAHHTAMLDKVAHSITYVLTHMPHSMLSTIRSRPETRREQLMR